jgi:hypothetical protein
MKWTSSWLLNRAGENITERLRKERLPIEVPVLVRGGTEGRLFEEATHSVSINAYGGMVQLSAEVVLAQQISIFNPKTQKELSALVTFVGLKSAGKRDISIEFSEPSVQFWGVGFPGWPGPTGMGGTRKTRGHM